MTIDAFKEQVVQQVAGRVERGEAADVIRTWLIDQLAAARRELSATIDQERHARRTVTLLEEAIGKLILQRSASYRAFGWWRWWTWRRG